MGGGEGTEGSEEAKGRSSCWGQRAGSSLELIICSAEIPKTTLQEGTHKQGSSEAWEQEHGNT